MRHPPVWGLLVVGLLAGCRQEAAVPALTRVNVVAAAETEFAPVVALTGVVAAQVQSEVAFRVGGKISERRANIGDHVKGDQVLARLDPADQQAELEATQASVRAAEATLRQTTLSFERQRNLLATGNTTRREHDQAEASFKSAQAQLEQARAQLVQATDQLAYTELHAGADGIIVAQMAEAGQVVAQAQPVFVLAHDGARDAVFNVHEWALANTARNGDVAVSLLRDPAVGAPGTVRVVSPAVDPSTMTVQVKVGLAGTPPAMTLGSLVIGTAKPEPRKVFLLPWSAVFEQAGNPAVWLVDPRSTTVSLRPIVIERFTRDAIAVTGLEPGQTVVSAGGQTLRPGQKVEIAERRQ
jgi:RND family efflux transporter MFP subunit